MSTRRRIFVRLEPKKSTRSPNEPRPKPIKTLFFGTSEFAVPSLRVVAERTDLRGVVTQPDRPAGRGQRFQPSPVKAAARELGITVHEPSNLREFASSIAAEDYDLFVLASYGKILPQSLLAVPRLGSFNVHPSLLPQYRGATPLQSALRDGANETGVTIMLMDAGMDTGDIVLQERTPIRPDETYGELHDRLAVFGAQALRHAIDLAQSGYILHEPQRGAPSVTKPIAKEDLRIDWQWDANRIINAVRAFSPQPAARADIAGAQVKLLRAEKAALATLNTKPGDVIGVAASSAIVRCGDGAVAIPELIPPNRNKMTGAQFIQTLGKPLC
ncbi:MAG: methionyl-tRNA formyltransferase [Vulcanimicrobiaceae bacterium]